MQLLRIEGSGLRVEGIGLRVEGIGLRVEGGDQDDVPHLVRALRKHRDRALERHFVPFVILIGGVICELFTFDINRIDIQIVCFKTPSL